PGTEGALVPFWSGDGRSIGFFAGGKLSKVPSSGGRPQTIAEISRPSGAAWNSAGDIIFSAGNRTALYHVRDSGGTPRQITQLDTARTENSHRSPRFLPGGRQYLYVSRCGKR